MFHYVYVPNARDIRKFSYRVQSHGSQKFDGLCYKMMGVRDFMVYVTKVCELEIFFCYYWFLSIYISNKFFIYLESQQVQVNKISFNIVELTQEVVTGDLSLTIFYKILFGIFIVFIGSYTTRKRPCSKGQSGDFQCYKIG